LELDVPTLTQVNAGTFWESRLLVKLAVALAAVIREKAGGDGGEFLEGASYEDESANSVIFPR
jgi:hypothetical protein